MKIITDTGSLYSNKEANTLGFDVLHLHVMINNQSYKEYHDISSEDFMKLVKEGYIPSSSQPAIGETLELLEKYKGEEILMISMADGLSGTYQSMASAANELNDPKIHVLNSKTLCGPERYLVQKALKLKEQNVPIEDVIDQLQASIDTDVSFLIPRDFEFLRRGGRLTPLASKISGILKIVAVMQKTEDGSKLEKFAIKKTFKGAIKEIIQALKKAGVDEDYIIAISHADAKEDAADVEAMIKDAFKDTETKIYPLSPAFITQGGIGCVAVQAIKK